MSRSCSTSSGSYLPEVEEDKLRRLLGRLNSYTESNLHDWLNKQPEPGIWCRTVDAGAQPREGGAPNE